MASPDVNGWEPVLGYEGLYEVSRLGQVRNAETRNHLSQFSTSKGYLIVALCKDGSKQNHKVHRLVATAFIRPPVNDEQVNHLDFDKTNNAVSNLDWETPKGNVAHFIEANPDHLKCLRSLSDEAVEQVKAMVSEGESQRAVARKFGVSSGTINSLISGKTYLSGTNSRQATT